MTKFRLSRAASTAAILAIALAGAAVHAEAAGTAATIAIAGIEARAGATTAQAALAADALAAQLVEDGKLRVVERTQLARVMREQALASSGVLSDEVQIKVAQLCGARFIAVGSVQGDGRGLVLGLRAIDSSSAQVVYADTLKLGGADQLDAAARKLARALAAKLVPAGALAAGSEASVPLGDFDLAQVRDGAHALARSLALRFPKADGKIVDALPNDTATCRFASVQGVFAGERFEVQGRDEVTESEVQKGFFLLGSISPTGCAGRVKRLGGQDIAVGDLLRSLPLQLSLDTLEAGPGTEPGLAKLFSDETRSALAVLPQFRLVKDAAQLNAAGRLAGARGHRTIQLQVTDQKGNTVQQLDLGAGF